MINEWSGSAAHGSLVLHPAGRRVPPARRPAAFLDRDGTLNEAVPDPETGIPESPLTVEEVRLIPGAAAAAKELADAGYVLVCVTNQPAAATGKATAADLLTVHERVVALLGQQGVDLAASHLCLHHDRGIVDQLSRSCDCRKPAPGMLLAAGAELDLDLGSSWILGDSDADVAAGRGAGCRTLLIEYPLSAHRRHGEVAPNLLAKDIGAGVQQLLDHRSR